MYNNNNNNNNNINNNKFEKNIKIKKFKKSQIDTYIDFNSVYSN